MGEILMNVIFMYEAANPSTPLHPSGYFLPTEGQAPRYAPSEGSNKVWKHNTLFCRNSFTK